MGSRYEVYIFATFNFVIINLYNFEHMCIYIFFLLFSNLITLLPNGSECFRSYGYYIDVSVNQVDWVRVVNHSTYYCRSWQHLFFKPRVVQYIKVVGTNNTVNMVIFFNNYKYILIDMLLLITHYYLNLGIPCSIFRGCTHSEYSTIGRWSCTT